MKVPNLRAEARISGYHGIHFIGNKVHFIHLKGTVNIPGISLGDPQRIRGTDNTIGQGSISPPEILASVDRGALLGVEIRSIRILHVEEDVGGPISDFPFPLG